MTLIPESVQPVKDRTTVLIMLLETVLIDLVWISVTSLMKPSVRWIWVVTKNRSVSCLFVQKTHRVHNDQSVKNLQVN